MFHIYQNIFLCLYLSVNFYLTCFYKLFWHMFEYRSLCNSSSLWLPLPRLRDTAFLRTPQYLWKYQLCPCHLNYLFTCLSLLILKWMTKFFLFLKKKKRFSMRGRGVTGSSTHSEDSQPELWQSFHKCCFCFLMLCSLCLRKGLSVTPANLELSM